MNDPRSMVIGWSALIIAAGTGYYFARKDLNERKREQTRQGLRGPPLDWREKIERDSAGIASEGSPKPNTAPGSSPAPTTATTPAPASASAKEPPDVRSVR